jgi:hypothetical protein
MSSPLWCSWISRSAVMVHCYRKVTGSIPVEGSFFLAIAIASMLDMNGDSRLDADSRRCSSVKLALLVFAHREAVGRVALFLRGQSPDQTTRPMDRMGGTSCSPGPVRSRMTRGQQVYPSPQSPQLKESSRCPCQHPLVVWCRG